MGEKWYYVENSERVGPVEKGDIESLYGQGSLNDESYVWRKGLENWVKICEIEDFKELINGQNIEEDVSGIPEIGDFPPRQALDLQSLDDNNRVITIKVGHDRQGSEAEYGPFSILQLQKAFSENRINERTFVFAPGMNNWKLLGDMEFFGRIAGSLPPVIEEKDRRVNPRRPFVARLLFHDNSEVTEGVCRDISIGGLQILVSDFPLSIGDSIVMNVHPENDDYSFVAKGVVARILDGNSGFSLRFESLSPEASKSIESYLQQP